MEICTSKSEQHRANRKRKLESFIKAGGKFPKPERAFSNNAEREMSLNEILSYAKEIVGNQLNAKEQKEYDKYMYGTGKRRYNLRHRKSRKFTRANFIKKRQKYSLLNIVV